MKNKILVSGVTISLISLILTILKIKKPEKTKKIYYGGVNLCR